MKGDEEKTEKLIHSLCMCTMFRIKSLRENSNIFVSRCLQEYMYLHRCVHVTFRLNEKSREQDRS